MERVNDGSQIRRMISQPRLMPNALYVSQQEKRSRAALDGGRTEKIANASKLKRQERQRKYKNADKVECCLKQRQYMHYTLRKEKREQIVYKKRQENEGEGNLRDLICDEEIGDIEPIWLKDDEPFLRLFPVETTKSSVTDVTSKQWQTFTEMAETKEKFFVCPDFTRDAYKILYQMSCGTIYPIITCKTDIMHTIIRGTHSPMLKVKEYAYGVFKNMILRDEGTQMMLAKKIHIFATYSLKDLQTDTCFSYTCRVISYFLTNCPVTDLKETFVESLIGVFDSLVKNGMTLYRTYEVSQIICLFTEIFVNEVSDAINFLSLLPNMIKIVNTVGIGNDTNKLMSHDFMASIRFVSQHMPAAMFDFYLQPETVECFMTCFKSNDVQLVNDCLDILQCLTDQDVKFLNHFLQSLDIYDTLIPSLIKDRKNYNNEVTEKCYLFYGDFIGDFHQNLGFLVKHGHLFECIFDTLSSNSPPFPVLVQLGDIIDSIAKTGNAIYIKQLIEGDRLGLLIQQLDNERYRAANNFLIALNTIMEYQNDSLSRTFTMFVEKCETLGMKDYLERLGDSNSPYCNCERMANHLLDKFFYCDMELQDDEDVDVEMLNGSIDF
uniref:IBB domain-containing protein n=1 Tax=Rhabditophanes sp. KR3021 TaxID=114890 RepID=A0AC35TV28_9BILA